jgi:hypothetical protein
MTMEVHERYKKRVQSLRKYALIVFVLAIIFLLMGGGNYIK